MSEKEKFTHGKVKTYYVDEKGIITTDTESFYENPSAYMREITKNIKTSKENILSDLISCLGVITNKQSHELVLTIKTDEFYMPTQIIKTWLEKKETFKKR